MDEHLTKSLDVEQVRALLTRWGVHHSAAPDVRSSQQPEQPPEQPGGRPPVLNPAGLPTVNGRLSAPYREIVQLFQQEAARRRAALDVAVAVPDRVEVARIAHTLAGSSSSIGALRLAAACSALEVLMKGPAPPPPSPSGRADDAPPDTDRALADAVEEVRRELREVEAALARL
jgi:HPt (histidine-containing phosphotransfer) domain-containing protein